MDLEGHSRYMWAKKTLQSLIPDYVNLKDKIKSLETTLNENSLAIALMRPSASARRQTGLTSDFWNFRYYQANYR